MKITEAVRQKLESIKIPGIKREAMSELAVAIEEELKKPPCIALIGETGVGKSTTINAMFNAGLDISHTKACTKVAEELKVPVNDLEGNNGTIRIFDMPGLGEDIDADEIHKETYRKVLPRCDVVLWVLKADSRTMTQTQIALRDIVQPAMNNAQGLVIGINQIDLIQPGIWNKKYNLPSSTQEESIGSKISDVKQKIAKVCSISDGQIVPYSALCRYRLQDLLGVMLKACPNTRAWVLDKCVDVADFKQLVDESVTELVLESKKNGNGCGTT